MGVDASSLIFVVIIGIWAVYLLQHWVRRREQLATSRSLDRFSGAMRVLERRAPTPVALPASTNRTYVVASTRLSRTEVAMEQPRPVRPARPARPAPRRRTHRVRALVLLTLLVATPVMWLAHVFGTLLLWPALTVTALLVLDLLLVRSAVRRSAAARRLAARRTATGSARPAAPRRRPSAGTTARTFPVAPSRAVLAAGGTGGVERTATVTTTAAATAVVVEEGPRRHSQDAITEVIVLDGGWEPVAVPPPTYTMKAKAERATIDVTALEADSDSAPAREPRQPLVPAVAIDDFDLDSVLDRRRAAGE